MPFCLLGNSTGASTQKGLQTPAVRMEPQVPSVRHRSPGPPSGPQARCPCHLGIYMTHGPNSTVSPILLGHLHSGHMPRPGWLTIQVAKTGSGPPPSQTEGSGGQACAWLPLVSRGMQLAGGPRHLSISNPCPTRPGEPAHEVSWTARPASRGSATPTPELGASQVWQRAPLFTPLFSHLFSVCMGICVWPALARVSEGQRSSYRSALSFPHSSSGD